ncbi:hypothetical protein [Vulcanisaeta distributa]|uniref:hypothetical protein n=1 Tax=Vulcanisaeta distributa TaxID=164451 RepID=UPI0006D2B83A|nr:hypothetical protein [Vulcanisaeta distributa]
MPLGGVVIVLGLVFYYVYYEYYYLPQVRTLEWIKEALHSLMVRSGNWTIEYSGGGLLTGNDSIIEVWTIPASELPNSIFTYPFNPNAVYIVQFFILPNINETVGISQIEFPGGVTFEPLIVSGHPIFTNPPSNPASWTGWNVVEVNPNCVGNWTFVFVPPLKWTPLNFNNLTVWNEVYFNSPFNKSELLFNDTYWLEIFFNGSLLYSGVMTSTLQGITFNPPLNTPLVQYGVVSGTSQTACWTVLLAFPEDLNYINGYEVRIFTAFKENPFIFRVYTNNTLGFENLMNEVQSPKKIIVTLSFYNWTNPYTGWSWELYNVTSPFTQAMVEETLKAMSITPTPKSSNDQWE